MARALQELGPCKMATADSSIVEFKPIQQDISESLHNQQLLNELQSVSVQGHLQAAFGAAGEAGRNGKELSGLFAARSAQNQLP